MSVSTTTGVRAVGREVPPPQPATASTIASSATASRSARSGARAPVIRHPRDPRWAGGNALPSGDDRPEVLVVQDPLERLRPVGHAEDEDRFLVGQEDL